MPSDGSTTLTLSPQTEEERMRAALGLTPDSFQLSRPAEPGRPGRDGALSVTMVSTRRPFEGTDNARARLAALEGELKAERNERVAAQQALADARQTIQQLQAKLAHTEMGAAEALEAEHHARLTAEARVLEMTLAAAPEPKPEQQAEPKRRGRPPKTRQMAEGLAAPRRPGRPPKDRPVAEGPEQEPVQWWLPSYGASKAKHPRSKS